MSRTKLTGKTFWSTFLLIIILGGILTFGCSDEGNRNDNFLQRLKTKLSKKISKQELNRRHVLLLTVDTLRPDYLSCYGYDLPTSPIIDSLFSCGTHFTRALTPIPRTTQALASMLTGCYPHTTELRTLIDPMSPEVISIAQFAKNAGYNTIAVVSNHILHPKRELNRGFDIYDFAGDIRDAAHTTAVAISRLSTMSPDDSIFIWVHYIDPHVPYYPPAYLAREFDPIYNGPYKDHFGDVRGGIGEKAYPANLGKKRAVFQNDLPNEVNAHIRKLYAADIRFTDKAIDSLLKWMKQKLGDDWLIVFSSDHGESLGEHDFFYDHGDYVYNASLRVPLGFVFPRGDRLHGNRTVHDWVSLVDVMPTLMELLDLEIPQDLPYTIEGRSLVPYFNGEKLPPCAYFAECGRTFFPRLIKRRVSFNIAGRFRTVVFKDWKLIWTPGQTELEYELYNVADDPHETRNLIDSNPVEAKKLIKPLKIWASLSDGPELKKLSDEDIKMLRSLGYVQ